MRQLLPFPFRRGPLLALIPLLFALTSGPACGSEPLVIRADDQYAYARSLLDKKNWDAAANEFERFIHFFADDPRVPEARFSIATAHFGAGRFPDAAAVFGALTGSCDGAPLGIEANFMLSRSHARQGMIEQAMLDLHNLVAICRDPAVVDRAHFELGWLHVDQGRWQSADRAFGAITAGNQDHYDVADLRSALARSDAIAFRDPTTAGLLSVVPGGGQLYCGRYQDALAALLINTGLIWASWEAFDNDQPALGGVLAFVEFGFYAGNIFGAISSAHKFNRDRAAAFRDQLQRQRQARFSLAPTPAGAALCMRLDF